MSSSRTETPHELGPLQVETSIAGSFRGQPQGFGPQAIRGNAADDPPPTESFALDFTQIDY